MLLFLLHLMFCGIRQTIKQAVGLANSGPMPSRQHLRLIDSVLHLSYQTDRASILHAYLGILQHQNSSNVAKGGVRKDGNRQQGGGQGAER